MMKHQAKPPVLARWLFERVARTVEIRTVSGDMDEYFAELVSEVGRFRAKLWYWGHVLKSIPILLITAIYWGTAMFKNYIKIALRIIRKHKGYAFINIMGLAIGLASCILILVYVLHETGYDRFHENAERIYRVAMKAKIGDNPVEVANTPAPLAAAMGSDFPEVENVVRIYRQGRIYVRLNDQLIQERRFLWADTTLFDVFSLTLRVGDPKTVLQAPNSVILTPEMAKKYCRDEDPVGQTLILGDDSKYTVTGIVEQYPTNSHFHFDFLASFSSLEVSQRTQWLSNDAFTYILLDENTDASQVSNKLPEFSQKYVGPVIQQLMGLTYEQFENAGSYFGFSLQALRDIHLHSHLDVEFEHTGNFNTVVLFSAIALLILIVACINFINLATARSAQRACEVGIRKVVGSSRTQLIRQFLFESMFMVTTAAFLALILVSLFLPTFNQLVGKTFSLSFLSQSFFIVGLIFSILIVGFSAGIYPAFLLSSFRPVAVIKGNMHKGSKGKGFRNAMVVFQFFTSIVLFVGTIVIYNQLHFLRNKDLGFDKEHVLVIRSAITLQDQQTAFKNELLRNPVIMGATYSNALPEIGLSATFIRKEGEDSHENYTVVYIQTDYDFQKTFKLQLAQGRYFDPNRALDSLAVIVNESAVQAMGLDDPLNSRLLTTDEEPITVDIIGVFKDFHLQNLHERIRPLVMFIDDEPTHFLSVRIRPGDTEKAIDFIETQWRTFLADQPLEYQFFDEQLQRAYVNEMRTGQVITAFSILAIVIACLGLFGLVSFASEQRTKEIGIRKVLGASVKGIVVLLSKDFLRWIVLANLIAWPAAYYAMNLWLQNFAFRIDLEWWMFLLATLGTLLVAVFTMSFRSIRAATKNPVDSLHYE